MNETQKSVTEWCRIHYPNFQNRERLALEILTEAVELCMTLDIPEYHLREVFDRKVNQILSEGNSEAFPGELADVAINLWNFLENEHLTLEEVVTEKMKYNRSSVLDH
jgi:hypothetical protein